MPVELIKYAFSGGVFSRSLQGRSDLEKYDIALAGADNFFIDYRGGATSRAGFQFCEQIAAANDFSGARLFSFSFNRFIANNYLLVFQANTLRFIQDGAYVLEASKAISSIVGSVVTANAHGYSDGDMVQISSRSYIISSVTTNTFVTNSFASLPLTPEEPAGTVVQRVYTVPTPYTESMLPGLQFRQRRDMVRITSLDYPPMDLYRLDHASWLLDDYDRGGASVSAPSGLSATASAAGTASINWTVTAVDQQGRETYLTTIATLSSIVNYANDPGSVKFSWTPVAGAKFYRVYRSLVFPTTAQNSIGQQLGYIGVSYGTSFTDVNVTPNFTLTPPIAFNPFDEGQIEFIEITAPGSGYISNPTVSVSGGGGSGFVGLPLRSSSNTIEAVMILNGGSGYSAPVTVTISGGGGSGATATASLGATSGLRPAVSIFYGQRAWLMGTTAAPMTLYSGRSDDIFSFSRGQLATAADPYELEIEASELTPIRFAEALTDNLFIFTDSGVYQVAPTEGGFASTQRTQNGVGRVRPIAVNTELVFALQDGSGVRAIRPGSVPNAYVDADLSIFAGDFFTPEQEIVSWAYTRTPYRVIWAAKADGKMLSFTYVPEHNVYAWAPHSTRGNVSEVASVLENGVDRLYAVVARDTGVFIERMLDRDFATVEDIWEVDCGLATSPVHPAATVEVVDDGEDDWTVSASAAIFTSGDVGKHFRAGGGMGVVTAFNSSTSLTVNKVIDIEARKPQRDDYPPFEEGEWSLDPTITTVSGLRHLAGETVEVVGDGSFLGEFVVSPSGTITLDSPASKIIAGLPFTGYVETLPLAASDAIIDNRRVRVVGVGLRVEKSRSLWYGTEEALYELFDRKDERVGEPTRFQNGIRNVTVLAEWRNNGQIRIEKRGPAAISLLGYVIDAEIGDDTQ